ncbi:hypothetical protein AAFF_G00020830 [Aldrovandia affinis]|uniref:Uncharacterized protein n=1 Tax=Aldrovandia affinis TaxID=143900 RepID=A0AAD7S7G6_9TELE|nr:hypothetical protein AAFF_G00020830 [Aldrovandia affinis]
MQLPWLKNYGHPGHCMDPLGFLPPDACVPSATPFLSLCAEEDEVPPENGKSQNQNLPGVAGIKHSVTAPGKKPIHPPRSGSKTQNSRFTVANRFQTRFVISCALV